MYINHILISPTKQTKKKDMDTDTRRKMNDLEYEITIEGKIWSIKMARYVLPRITEGYNKVILCKKTKSLTYRLDHLVAQYFDLEKKDILFHKNRNNLDDRLKNLEWLTFDEYFEKLYGKEEKWKPIQDNPGFFISSFGRIWSIHKEDLIKCQKKNGYMATTIANKFTRIHQAMAKEFLEHKSGEGYFISHRDGNKLNNRLENLEICKMGSKMAKGWKKGIREKGERPEGRLWPSNDNIVVTEEGRVYEISSSTYLIPQKKSLAYVYVRINMKDYPIHRLVAETYIPKPSDECIQVNHKDGNKENNHVSNLEWVTAGQNVSHSINILHKEKMVTSLQKPVICTDKDGNETEYSGVKAASRATKVDSGSISGVCKGKGKTAGGYQWRYKD